MLKRNANHIVIAEDQWSITNKLQDFFERFLDKSVWTTDKVVGITSLVEKTNAGILIMDLELKDGDSANVIDELRRIYGGDLIIVVLTGKWKTHQESRLLRNGADVILRKPQTPQAIWQQVLNLIRRGETSDDMKGLVLSIQERFEYDVERGAIIRDDEMTKLPRLARNLMAQLAYALDKGKNQEDGWVSRGELLMAGWGEVDNVNVTGSNLRVQIFRLRELFPEGAIENHVKGRSESFYRLNPEIFTPLLEEGRRNSA